MKTNFTKERFLVLTNNESKIIAIIQSAAELQDIRERLTRAIAEDYDAVLVNVNVHNDLVLDDFNYEFDFSATINMDEYFYDVNFTLTFAAKY